MTDQDAHAKAVKQLWNIRKRVDRFREDRGPLLVPHGLVTTFVEDLERLLGPAPLKSKELLP